MDFTQLIQLVKSEFYWLHQHPELSGEEFATTERLRTFLTRHGVTIRESGLPTGLIADIRGQADGPVVALRCDIDALPVTEQTDMPYRSLVAGKMHACGHDFHAATLLGIALALRDEPDLPGTVRLVFQPAEENLGGARSVLQTGLLADVDVIFGFHCSAIYPRGTVITRPGFMNGAVDTFRVVFHGTGAHACRPHQSADPVMMLAHFACAAQTIVSRGLNPFHPAIVGISYIHAGNADNVIPSEGCAGGTIRSLHPEARTFIHQRLQALAETTAAQFGGRAEFILHKGVPATNNDAVWVEFAREIAASLHLPFAEPPDSLSGEDFACYQEHIPGAFIQIGTGLSPMNHCPDFRVDPETLHESVAFGTRLAVAALRRLKEQSHD